MLKAAVIMKNECPKLTKSYVTTATTAPLSFLQTLGSIS